jgi:hypothetical protein
MARLRKYSPHCDGSPISPPAVRWHVRQPPRHRQVLRNPYPAEGPCRLIGTSGHPCLAHLDRKSTPDRRPAPNYPIVSATYPCLITPIKCPANPSQTKSPFLPSRGRLQDSCHAFVKTITYQTGGIRDPTRKALLAGPDGQGEPVFRGRKGALPVRIVGAGRIVGEVEIQDQPPVFPAKIGPFGSVQ